MYFLPWGNKLPMPAHMFEPGFHPQLDMLYKDIEKTAEEWKVKDLDIMDIFFKRERLNIVFTSRMFQPEERSFDDSFKFVGPSIADREEGISFPFDELQGHKVVYISMGTINNNCLEFYEKCIEALEDPDFKVVMSVGKKVGHGFN
jgi:MGT family glycosyltransferase